MQHSQRNTADMQLVLITSHICRLFCDVHAVHVLLHAVARIIINCAPQR